MKDFALGVLFLGTAAFLLISGLDLTIYQAMTVLFILGLIEDLLKRKES